MSRRPAKPKSVADWQIIRIAKVAVRVGEVQAPDAETAIRRAIEKYDIKPEHQDRIAARQIVVR